ncbi:uncharacterized protein J3D65DRAFT_103514 [Phyllosticta citribraziliensis]|uniref:BTB domain-containing protein n=1 Tax=Phyllosticta citribraziliensis TaxID=989973 RepID=A0ABR1LAX5_9PEZI
MKSQLPNAARGSQQEIVKLIVGPSQTNYYIHMHIICCESAVMKAAFNSDFKEGKEKAMELEHIDEEVFEIIMHWMYTRELPGPNSEKRWKIQMSEDEEGDEVEFMWDFLMSSAYVFAKDFDMPLLASGIHSLFEERFQTLSCPRIATICRLFDNVPEDAWLCQLFVNQFAAYWRRDCASDADKKLFQYLPIAFFEQAFNAFAERRDGTESQMCASSSSSEGVSDVTPAPSPEI